MPVDPEKPNPTNEITRRKFIAVALGSASAMLIKPNLVRGTAANSAVRVGLLGCGGRGTEDASNLVDTGGARVVALGDMFQDQLDIARQHFDGCNRERGTPHSTLHSFLSVQMRTNGLRHPRKWMR